MSSSDPFSARFDSIAVDSANAPSAEAIDRALSFVAPAAASPDLAAPGFHLLDDAGGRFVVDSDMGVISVANDDILAREPGQVHAVRLRVTEASGVSYELDMRLKLTGRVPQMLGAEEFGAIAGLTADIAPAPVVVITPARTPWTRFAVMQGMGASAPLGGESPPYGALLSVDLSRNVATATQLTLGAKPPAPGAARAVWSI
jgi:hypothetical protein